MIGGKIIRWEKTQNSVLFYVQGTGIESNDFMKVKAKVPDATLAKIEVGDDIWWQGYKVYISFDGYQDIDFEKVGFSSSANKSVLNNMV
jgi:hypothetical protein